MIQDDANAWFESQGQEIQDYEAPALPEVEADDIIDEEEGDRPYGDAPEVTNDDVRNVMNMRAVSKPTAEVIVGTLDVLLPLAVTLLLRGTSKDDCRLDDTERETLVEAWATYLADKNVAVSPGTALVIAMVTIYGAKVSSALAARRERRELEEARQTASRLEAELTAQRQQTEMLQESIERMKNENK